MTCFRRVAFALALLGPMLAGCTPDDTPTRTATRTVHVETVRAAPDGDRRAFTGTLRAPLESNLSFRVSGQVVDVRVDVGTEVQAGAVIARLDADDYRLEVEAAQASYRRAKAAAENARAELQRVKALYAEDNASLSAYDRARTHYETTQNQAKSAERQLDLARKRLGYTRLTAPASGSIADTFVESGENVAVGQPVVRLTSGQRLEVRVEVPEDVVPSVTVGQSVYVTATPMDGPVDATVTEVASAPAGGRPTYPVVVTLNREVPVLRSGMTARVSFDLGSSDGVTVSPDAVGEDDRGRYVYVVRPDTATSEAADSAGSTAEARVVRRHVDTGALTANGLVVTSGLDAGERIVTAGVSHVRDGDAVRISRLLSADRRR